MATHVIACAWYAIGVYCDEEDSENWVRENGLYKETNLYRYFKSMHWSLTQFTPASMEVRAHNTFEQIYSVVILIFAMVSFSSFLGSLTTMMTQLRNLHQDERKHFWTLRQYLKEAGIHKETSARITLYLEYRWRKQQESVQE